MNFSTASPYLESIVIKKKENTEGILELEPKISVSGGLPLKMFSKYYGGGPTDKSVDSIVKIGGLSVPIGLVLRPENRDTVHVKYSQNAEKTEETEEGTSLRRGGSPEEKEGAPEEIEDKKDEDTPSESQEDDIEEINGEDMDNLLNMVCKLHKKQLTRKKKQM
jgi:hypothetical protein